MKECEHKQIRSCDKTALEEELDFLENQGWEVGSLKIERVESKRNKKNGGAALFVADLVRFSPQAYS